MFKKAEENSMNEALFKQNYHLKFQIQISSSATKKRGGISEAKRLKTAKDKDERIKMEVNKQVFKDVVEMLKRVVHKT